MPGAERSSRMPTAPQRTHETDGEAAPGPIAPGVLTGLPLLQSIEELAKTWHGQSWKSQAAPAGPGIMTPEELAVSAAEHGVDVRFEQRGLAALGPGDMPCVALTKEGRG